MRVTLAVAGRAQPAGQQALPLFRRWQRHWLQLGLVLLFLPGAMPGLGLAVPSLHAQSSEQPFPGHVLKTWTTRDGLPQNRVGTLLQTRDGYLWIGTRNAGLVRFDGVGFTVFDITNTPSLPSNWVSTLHEDADGVLWIGTAAGLVAYKDGVFATERISDDATLSAIVAVVPDSHGATWVASSRHVARRDGDRWTTIYGADSSINGLAIDDEGAAWIATDRGLVMWQAGEVRTLTTADGLPSTVVRAVYETQAGEMWVGTARGLGRIDRKDRAVRAEPAPLGTAPANRLFEDRNHTLWIGSEGRLAARPRDGPPTVHTIADRADGGSVSAITADREGHLWFGVDGGRGGLHRLGPQRVTVLSHADGLPCDNVGPVSEGADGTLWVATLCSDGRGLVALRGGRPQLYDGPTFVWSILAEQDGNVWAGTYDGQLFHLDPSSGQNRFVPYPIDTPEPLSAIVALHRDEQGTLWVGTGAGLYRHAQGRWTRVGAAAQLSNDHVRSIVAGKDGSVWVGTDAGLHHYQQGRFTNYAAAEWLARAPVRAIHVDAEGIVWIGTYGGGLCRLKSDRIHCFGTQGGLLDTSVHRLMEDEAGYLWMTGDRGIRRVVRRELDEVAEGRHTVLSVVVVDEADGMKSAECNGLGQPAGWRMRDGTLQVPTQRGLVHIAPAIVDDIEFPLPAPIVEQASIDGTFYPVASTLTAPPGSTDFEIRYSAPSFARPTQIQFRYRLDGYDADWIDAGNRRVAHYANLAPGSYQFHVAARDTGGSWSEGSAVLGLVLRPHLYQRLPVQVGLGLLALLGVLAGLRLRMAGMRERARRLETVVADRTAEVARQRDEVADARDRLDIAKKVVEQAHGQVLAVLSQLDLGVMVLDQTGIVRYVSEAAQRLLHNEAANIVGRPWTECLPIVEIDRVQMQARIETPSPVGARVPVQMVLGGKRYWMEMDVREEPHPGTGRILYIYSVTEMSSLSTRGNRHEGPHDLVGRSTAMHVVYKQIRDVARVDATVLIEGETGSGKELVARAIHRGSRRADKPFVAINSAGLAESLLASQLFGHRRGAFTGAIADQVGVFEAANGGTLFLDEIGDIPMSVQVSLLRVLQEREITRVGESRVRHLDVRFLAATHRDLTKEVAEGRFRQDLLYRIRVATIRVPPLRDRLDDVPLLVEAFMAQAARQSGRAIPEVSHEAMAALMRYQWPGNVRQLKSAVEHSLLGSTGRVLRLEDLPAEIVSNAPLRPAAAAGDRDRLMDALQRAGGNRSEAARLLGIGRATLYRRLAAHGIVDDA
jgi:transcriptional regulator with PAS, ATPase and Fis domain/ligand-binding sensor domain-containing protein